MGKKDRKEKQRQAYHKEMKTERSSKKVKKKTGSRKGK
jgi:hypothetical protein